MNLADKLWVALGKAIRVGATEKQINGIAARLARAQQRRVD